MGRTNDLAATVDVRFGIFTGSRQFNILVSQFNCDDKNKPPDGCTQYFTGKTGNLSLLIILSKVVEGE